MIHFENCEAKLLNAYKEAGIEVAEFGVILVEIFSLMSPSGLLELIKKSDKFYIEVEPEDVDMQTLVYWRKA